VPLSRDYQARERAFLFFRERLDPSINEHSNVPSSRKQKQNSHVRPNLIRAASAQQADVVAVLIRIKIRRKRNWSSLVQSRSDSFVPMNVSSRSVSESKTKLALSLKPKKCKTRFEREKACMVRSKVFPQHRGQISGQKRLHRGQKRYNFRSKKNYRGQISGQKRPHKGQKRY